MKKKNRKSVHEKGKTFLSVNVKRRRIEHLPPTTKILRQNALAVRPVSCKPSSLTLFDIHIRKWQKKLQASGIFPDSG